MRIPSAIALLLIFILLPLQSVSAAPQAEAVLKEKCSTPACHLHYSIVGKTPEEWNKTMLRMQKYGAPLTREEASALQDFLSEKYPPEEIPLVGSKIAEKRCTTCHSSLLFEIPRTMDEWEEIVDTMRRYGANLTEEESAVLKKYLFESHGVEDHLTPKKDIMQAITVKAAHDGERVYLQFQWEAEEGTQAKDRLSLMLGKGVVAFETSGCFANCHSRGDSEVLSLYQQGIKQKSFLERIGMWREGKLTDLWTWSASSNRADDQFVFKFRDADFAEDSRDDVRADSEWKAGRWTVTLVRKLDTGNDDDVDLKSPNAYTIGIALHRNGAYGRQHYVTFPHTLGLGAEARIKAAKVNGEPNWDSIAPIEIKLFLSGMSSWEIVSKKAGTWHPFTKEAVLTGEAKCSNCHIEGRFQNLIEVKTKDGFTIGAATCQTCMREEEAAVLGGIGANYQSGQDGRYGLDRYLDELKKWWYLDYSETSGEFSQRGGYFPLVEGKATEVRDFKEMLDLGPTAFITFALAFSMSHIIAISILLTLVPLGIYELYRRRRHGQ